MKAAGLECLATGGSSPHVTGIVIPRIWTPNRIAQPDPLRLVGRLLSPRPFVAAPSALVPTVLGENLWITFIFGQ
jgi:hypothetical protein